MFTHDGLCALGLKDDDLLPPNHPTHQAAVTGRTNNGFMSRARFIAVACFSSHFNRVDVDQANSG
jgi:hypothetical protein